MRGAFGLSLSAGPLFGFVARLVHQKGFDLVLEASETIVARGGQVVIVGRGEPEYERGAAELARRYPHAVGARIGFDAAEARCVFAGADFLLMPSRYEPCGLSQMYAQRFGALPIGHRTGGLAETIETGRTGFLFERLDIAAFDDAIEDAFAVFGAPTELQAMRRAAMAKDFGWAESALAYSGLYRKLVEARRPEAKPQAPPPPPPSPRSVAKRAAPRVVDEAFAAAASRADARALQRLAAAAAASIGRRPPRG